MKWMPLRRSRGGIDSVMRGGGGEDGGGRSSKIVHAAFVSQVACGVRPHTLVAKGLITSTLKPDTRGARELASL